MFRPSVLLLALLLSGSTLWSAFMDGSMSITTALTRFLIAVPVAGAMVHVFTLVTANNRRPVPPAPPLRQAADSELERS